MVSRRAFFSLLVPSLWTITHHQSHMPSNQAIPQTTPITDVKKLETRFNNLSPGETLHISPVNAPYRTTQWLDIDTNGITVIGPGIRNLIQPADGADIGGIRIGHHQQCQDIRVSGVGYAGNPTGQGGNAERLHGISVRNARNVSITDNHIQKTHPTAHGNGGSGISVTNEAINVRITGNTITQYGDRGIQLGGQRVMVSGNFIQNGLDRAISGDLWYSKQENQTVNDAVIAGNIVGNAIEGSLIGVARNDPSTPSEGCISIFGNIGFGTHKSFCQLRGTAAIENVSIHNNMSVQESTGLETNQKTFAGVGSNVAEGRNFTIKDNELHDYSGHGIHLNGDIANAVIQDNTITDSGFAGIRVADADGAIVDGNIVSRPGGTSGGSVPGILINAPGLLIRNNIIREHQGPAIEEEYDAGDAIIDGNIADGENPWRITAASSRVRNNYPAFEGS